jgi:WS/DGAT/MGAT family acyltransferase
MSGQSHHERLSALDASFLAIEDRCCHMHIGSVGTFDGTGLGAGRSVDIERVRQLTEVALENIPRYRQRIGSVPLLDHPVWVDDASFNINYHLRHTRLPYPGDERQLKRLAGRLMSQQLDRGKPLWETWVVEGLEGDRFAIISKLHHCMVDGIGGVELTTATMRTEPGDDPRLEMPPPPFVARPIPSGAGLIGAELRHRAMGALGFAGSSARAILTPVQAAQTLAGTMGGLAEGLGTGLRPASPTPLNVAIGPHRRLDWTVMELAAIRDIKNRLGGTVNDVVLTVVAGAVREYLGRRGVDVDKIDFRAMVPVNIRGDYRGSGNRVASVIAHLPVQEPDPCRRLELVHRETEALKSSKQVDATRVLEDLSDWAFTTLIAQATRLAGVSQPFNVVVTNVPGPQFPLYILGARMLDCFPVVPIFQYQALGIALFGYDGRLFWGFHADWEAMPDLHEFVLAIDESFRTLAVAAGVEEPGKRTGTPSAAISGVKA